VPAASPRGVDCYAEPLGAPQNAAALAPTAIVTETLDWRSEACWRSGRLGARVRVRLGAIGLWTDAACELSVELRSAAPAFGGSVPRRFKRCSDQLKRLCVMRRSDDLDS